MSLRSFVGWLRRLVVRVVLLVVVPVVALAVGVYFYAESGRYVVTENAYVKSNVIAISANVDGRVEWVGAEDNTAVRAGQVLFRLDAEPFRVALDQAEAELSLVRTQVEHLRNDYRATLVEVDEARERVDFLTRQFQRQERLREKKLGREEQYDAAAHELSMAKQQVRLLEQRIARRLLSLGNDPDIPVERHARHQRAKAERDRAALQLSYTTVFAPANGIVSNMRLQAGEYVEEGEPVFGIVEANAVWVEANLKETQLAHVDEGQRAVIEVDAYPEHEWHAFVDAIAPATGAEFAVLPPQNATGNWVKVVQRVPVRLDIEARPGTRPLRAGMTVTVTIDTERERATPVAMRDYLGDRDWLAEVRRIGREALVRAGLRVEPPDPTSTARNDRTGDGA